MLRMFPANGLKPWDSLSLSRSDTHCADYPGPEVHATGRRNGSICINFDMVAEWPFDAVSVTHTHTHTHTHSRSVPGSILAGFLVGFPHLCHRFYRIGSMTADGSAACGAVW